MFCFRSKSATNKLAKGAHDAVLLTIRAALQMFVGLEYTYASARSSLRAGKLGFKGSTWEKPLCSKFSYTAPAVAIFVLSLDYCRSRVNTKRTFYLTGRPMVGLVLLYFVGKAFYDLAGLNDKSPWLYAILGVGSYYAGLIVGGILIAIGYEVFVGSVDEVNDTLLGVLALPIGVLACWGFYRILKSRWEKREVFSGSSEDVLDANLMDQTSDRG